MNYYALQVRTRSEEKFIKLFNNQHPESSFQLYFPKRRINIRKEGKVILSTLPVFPGYIFLEETIDDELIKYQWAFRQTEGFFRFLKSNHEITPLTSKDLKLVLHFIQPAGSITGISKVYYDENSRIVVLEGALAGLEGNIIKVDKRKGRAKIKLDLFNDSFTIDLCFEVIRPADSVKKAS